MWNYQVMDSGKLEESGSAGLMELERVLPEELHRIVSLHGEEKLFLLKMSSNERMFQVWK